MNLRIPGPTPCPPDVLGAVGGQMINHRGPEFAALLERLSSGLQPFFQTRQDVLLMTCSGTGGMEAAIVNTLSPGDRVLAISIGAFGDRFAEIARLYGADVTMLEVEWGRAVEIEQVRDALRAASNYRAVLVTHNETSTGVTNPLEEISDVVHTESDALLLVDAVSSLGSIPLATDVWGVDVAVTASQKGWLVPPGLAMLAFSDRAWAASERATMPRFYLDARMHRDFAAKGQTPTTPVLPVLYGLDVALARMRQEGRAAVFERHARVAKHTREGVKALGLKLLASEAVASDTVTAVRVPEGVDGKSLARVLREKRETVIAGGQGKLAGKIFRIGHLGWVDEPDIDRALDALQATLPEVGSEAAVAPV